MQRIPRQQAMEYFFDGRKPPRIRVKPGESFVAETEDAFSGRIRSLEDLLQSHTFPTAQTTPKLSNPMAGPIYVEGAEKGDLLAVRIESIEVAEVGHTSWTSWRGPLRDSKQWADLSEPYVHAIHHLPGPSGGTRDGKGVLNEHVSWNLRPFIGTIGVAPEVEVVTSSVGQGPWGGNIDCRDMKEGSTAYFPVFHEGAMLYLGDVHASQGDTEFYGAADESRAEVTVSCQIVKGKSIPYVRLEKPESLVSLYCFRPLENAVESAIVNLMEWMVEDYGLSQREAYLHACVNPDFRIHVYQMVRIGSLQYTVGAEIPRRYLENR
ncbi:MAG: acetamidase/formamidase family protein [Armatimonadetes bacterium]|nr:acetamidase/formamidase family protein [Armatimonadota bacterium]